MLHKYTFGGEADTSRYNSTKFIHYHIAVYMCQMTTMKVALDILPLDLLKQIFSHLEIGDFTHLLGKAERSFLQQNPKLKYTIEQVIKDNPNVQLKYTSNASFLDDLYFLEDRSIPDRLRVKTRQQLVIVHDYCVNEGINTVFNITYALTDLIDIIDFQQLFMQLQPAKAIKYAVQITFSSSCRYKINMEQLHNLFVKVKDNIHSLTMELASDTTKIMGKVKTDYFKNLEILRLNKFLLDGSLAKYTNLKELAYVSADKCEVFELGQLPPSLKHLELVHFSELIWPQDKDSWNSCPSLESIVLQFSPWNRQLKLPKGLANIVQHMTCKETKIVRFEGNDRDDGYSEEFWKLLAAASHEKGFTLDYLSVQLVILSPIETYPLTNLDIVAIANPQVLSQFQFPPTLKSLRIAWVVEHDTSDLFKAIPLGIRQINLRGSKIDWCNSDLNFAKFVNLKELVLSRTKLGKYLSSCLFPDSIQLLKLDDNGLGSIDEITFPKKLKFVSILMNGITKLCKPDFPSTLKELNISNNRLKEFDISKNKAGETLDIKVLYFNENKCKVNSLDWSKFPPKLKGLSLKEYKFCHTNYSFGVTLEYLRMTETDLVQLRSISFAKFTAIKYLYLPQCNMRKFNIKIPETVEELDISANRIPEFPTQLCELKNLRVLDMSFNDMSKVQIDFQYNTIEVLNFGDNDITEIELRFPPTVTNLKVLDLSHNLLKELSMKSIGHTGQTLHSNLYGVILSGNTKFLKDKIGALIKEMPDSCECLWHDTYKDSENTEIDMYNHYVSNELPGHLVQNKDVSTCRKMFGKNIRMALSPEKNDKSLIKQPLIFAMGRRS